MMKYTSAWLITVLVLAYGSWTCSSGNQSDPNEGTDCQVDEDCSDDQVCVSDVCVDCRSNTDCLSDQICLQGECLTLCPSDNLCKDGGTCCPGDWECIDKLCYPPCAGQRCGDSNELCCSTGEVCEEGRCMTDCGGAERCGQDFDTCCSAEQICYRFECTQPQGECISQYDCPDGTVCELDLGICIDEEVIGECLYHPPTGQFSPEIECRWTTTEARNDVVMAPVVANLTDDNGDGKTDTFDTPDIVFISYDYEGDGCCNSPGTLRIVSGRCNPDKTMQTIASISDPPMDNSGGIAIGDLDGDGVPEIVAMLKKSNGTIAFKRAADDGSSWEVFWENQNYPDFQEDNNNPGHTCGGAQPALADLDGDGTPEVIIGNVVLNGLDGSLRWDGLTNHPANGIGNNAFLGPVSTVADIDLDGKPEILAGHTCYEDADGSTPNFIVQWSFDYSAYPDPPTSCNNRKGPPCDGYTAAANFDDDEYGEVVIVRQGEVFVLEHTGELKAKIQLPLYPSDPCSYNEAGPPTVADFDGDGQAEIGTAGADYYVVVDLECDQALPDRPAKCDQDPDIRGVLWKVRNQDCSSRVTASSVFDFEGDGQAEVIYADETSFRIFDGLTGEVLFEDPTHGSHTRLEAAVIADVDNDGNAEVVIAENAAEGGTPGVEVWGDADDNWVFTRRIWNQHSYHVSNVSESGVIPKYEEPNWQQSYLNNFRQNVQGEGLFWAPDLIIDNLGYICHFDDTLTISFDLLNQGSRMVGQDTAVTIYVDNQAIETLRSTKALLPGHFEHFTWQWTIPTDLQNGYFDLAVVADDVGDGSGEHNECEDGGEDNNSAEEKDLSCLIIE